MTDMVVNTLQQPQTLPIFSSHKPVDPHLRTDTAAAVSSFVG